MFTFLGNIMSGLLTALWDALTGLLKSAGTFFVSVWGIVVAFGGGLLIAFTTICTLIDELAVAIGDMFFPASADVSGSLSIGGFEHYYRIANTFTPVTEVAAYCVAYFGLIIVLNIYRLIKSWIPTLS